MLVFDHERAATSVSERRGSSSVERKREVGFSTTLAYDCEIRYRAVVLKGRN